MAQDDAIIGPFHRILNAALDAAPVWDWSYTGVFVPADLFDILIAEGADERGLSLGGSRMALVVFGGCPIWVYRIWITCVDNTDRIFVQCQNRDCYTHHLTAHERLKIAAFRAKTVHFPSKNQSPAPDGRG